MEILGQEYPWTRKQSGTAGGNRTRITSKRHSSIGPKQSFEFKRTWAAVIFFLKKREKILILLISFADLLSYKDAII